VMATALLRFWALAAVTITIVLGVSAKRLLVGQLGGVNGDAAGACQQVLEVALLLLASGHSVTL
jgi:cobalamin synthase